MKKQYDSKLLKIFFFFSFSDSLKKNNLNVNKNKKLAGRKKELYLFKRKGRIFNEVRELARERTNALSETYRTLNYYMIIPLLPSMTMPWMDYLWPSIQSESVNNNNTYVRWSSKISRGARPTRIRIFFRMYTNSSFPNTTHNPCLALRTPPSNPPTPS